MLLFCIIAITSITHVFGSCSTSSWGVASGTDSSMCSYSGGTFNIKCSSKHNADNCGMRLNGRARLGQGTYQASIKAAPGSGVNTKFYLYSYGRNNGKSKAWNEIDIEIMGNHISNGQTKVWTNVWTGHWIEHGKFVTLSYDASKSYHTYAIKIDSQHIYWIFNGQTKRQFDYTKYSDLADTINTLDFQAEMALTGSTDSSSDQGSMSNNHNSFPLHAYFKSVKINKCSNCNSNPTGGASGDSGDTGGSTNPNPTDFSSTDFGSSQTGLVHITNEESSNKWWYAVVLDNIPWGVSVSWVKIKPKGSSGWEKGIKQYDYYYFTKHAPYSGPIDFKIKFTNGQTITSLDVIRNPNPSTSGYMDQPVYP